MMGPQSSKTTEEEQSLEEILTKLLPKNAAKKILESANVCVSAVHCLSDLCADDLSQLIKDSYGYVLKLWNSRCRNKPSTSREQDIELGLQLLEAYERVICSRSYDVLFYHRSDDEVMDMSLQERIRSLKWVTAGFLETNLDLESGVVVQKLDQAMKELLKMNQRIIPQHKLDSILSCSHHILEALQVSLSGKPAGADDFLPALIYLVLRSNPPLLQSNIDFITRFSIPSNIHSGERAYYFTSLCSAKEYIQNLKPEYLDVPITKEDFDAYIYSHSPSTPSFSSPHHNTFSFDVHDSGIGDFGCPSSPSSDYKNIASVIAENYSHILRDSPDKHSLHSWLEIFSEDFETDTAVKNEGVDGAASSSGTQSKPIIVKPKVSSKPPEQSLGHGSDFRSL